MVTQSFGITSQILRAHPFLLHVRQRGHCSDMGGGGGGRRYFNDAVKRIVECYKNFRKLHIHVAAAIREKECKIDVGTPVGEESVRAANDTVAETEV